MTKAEELKLLQQIEDLVLTAPADSYIAKTFAGMGEVCRDNIDNDFGVIPVQDMEEYLEARDAEIRMHDETKRQLADSQKMCKESLDENDRLRKLVAELTEQRDAMSDCVNGLQEIVDAQEIKIRNLKAEIVHMKLDRMTYDEYSELYDKMNEEE